MVRRTRDGHPFRIAPGLRATRQLGIVHVSARPISHKFLFADNLEVRAVASAAVLVLRFNQAGRGCFSVLCFGPEHLSHRHSQIPQGLCPITVITRAMHNGQRLRLTFR